MSFKNGPMVSPDTFREFIAPPYYKRITVLRARGREDIFVDTDGDCWLLIPEFQQAGVAGMYPFEVQAGMDIVEVRKKHPDLLIIGGLNKNLVAKSKADIDRELEAKLPFMLRHGKYIPTLDHMAHPEISWENFLYYRRRVREYVEKYQPD